MDYTLLTNGVYWGYNPLILTIDPNFQQDIQVGIGVVPSPSDSPDIKTLIASPRLQPAEVSDAIRTFAGAMDTFQAENRGGEPFCLKFGTRFLPGEIKS